LKHSQVYTRVAVLKKVTIADGLEPGKRLGAIMEAARVAGLSSTNTVNPMFGGFESVKQHVIKRVNSMHSTVDCAAYAEVENDVWEDWCTTPDADDTTGSWDTAEPKPFADLAARDEACTACWLDNPAVVEPFLAAAPVPVAPIPAAPVEPLLAAAPVPAAPVPVAPVPVAPVSDAAARPANAGFKRKSSKAKKHHLH
jgi:hypothetical protein